MVRFAVLLLGSFFFWCCGNAKRDVIQYCDVLLGQVEAAQYDLVKKQLDDRSTEFVEDLWLASRDGIDAVLDVGMRYRMPYFAMSYYQSSEDYIKDTDDPFAFFHYLSLEQVACFDKRGPHTTLIDQTRLGDPAMLACSKTINDENRIYWLELDRVDDQWKLNLMYTISLLDEKLKRIIQDQYQWDDDIAISQQLKSLYAKQYRHTLTDSIVASYRSSPE